MHVKIANDRIICLGYSGIKPQPVDGFYHYGVIVRDPFRIDNRNILRGYQSNFSSKSISKYLFKSIYGHKLAISRKEA